MDERKKCPFCGYTITDIPAWAIEDHTEFTVRCQNCGACGPNGLSVHDAIRLWNMRREVYPPAHNREARQ